MTDSENASNWVDRGAPPEAKLGHVLAHYLGQPDLGSAPPHWFDQAVLDVIGMVAADASEVEVAAYVRTLARSHGRTDPDELRGARLVAVALWHVAKAAEVRDRAKRVLAHLAPQVPPPPLSDWLAARLLVPSELARHLAESQREEKPPRSAPANLTRGSG